jgi:AcrR family transcriptional regulator
MRQSNRDRILEGVVRIIERDGVTAVTFDAVAAETGLTRGGLIYHFRSREDLILATNKHLAARWEQELKGLMQGPDTAMERYAAYVRASVRDATRAELLMMLESVSVESLAGIWSEVIGRWAPPPPTEGDAASMDNFLVRLAADGMWAHEAAPGQRLPPEVKEQVSRAIIASIRPR